MFKEVGKKLYVFVSLRVCVSIQNTVYASWHASEGNNQPQAGNDCDRAAPVELVYASVVFGPVKMQRK